MIDEEWLNNLKVDVKSHNPDTFLDEYVLKSKDELLSYATIYPKDTIYYRGRIGYKTIYSKYDASKKIRYPYYRDDLKNPPNHLSEAGRFNRDGYSYLYLCSDTDTCIAELRVKIGAVCSVCQFKQKSDLKLLDLDRNKALKQFLTVPVCDENYYHYKFTRFISDLIRKIGLDGIAYDSVQGSGKCFVIFEDSMLEVIDYSEKMYMAERVKFDYKELTPDFAGNNDYEDMLNSENEELIYMSNNPNYNHE